MRINTDINQSKLNLFITAARRNLLNITHSEETFEPEKAPKVSDADSDTELGEEPDPDWNETRIILGMGALEQCIILEKFMQTENNDL